MAGPLEVRELRGFIPPIAETLSFCKQKGVKAKLVEMKIQTYLSIFREDIRVYQAITFDIIKFKST